MEIWKNIDTGNEYDKYYQISNTGKARRLPREVHNHTTKEKELSIRYTNSKQPFFRFRFKRKPINIYIKPQIQKLFNMEASL